MHILRSASRALVLPLLLAVAPLAHADDSRKSLTPDQRKEVAAIANEFRRARDADARLALIEKAAAVHPSAIEGLSIIVGKELTKELTSYRQQFGKAAAGAVGQRVNPASVQEIAALRTRVLGLAKQEELTKEQIVEVSDPALARLKELILIKPSDILAGAPDVAKRRESLEGLARQWAACSKILTESAASESSEPVAEPPSFEEYLAKEEEIATAFALPMDQRTRQVLAANTALAARIDPEEARCVMDLNMTRTLLGLPPVAIDLALTQAARVHSADMEQHNFFSHESPLPGKKSFTDRARLFNTSASGENIAMGTTDGARANEMWWHSPGHHKNMLGEHRRVGVGRSKVHWTELFGR